MGISLQPVILEFGSFITIEVEKLMNYIMNFNTTRNSNKFDDY